MRAHRLSPLPVFAPFRLAFPTYEAEYAVSEHVSQRTAARSAWINRRVSDEDVTNRLAAAPKLKPPLVLRLVRAWRVDGVD
jgi:hypothetical protein